MNQYILFILLACTALQAEYSEQDVANAKKDILYFLPSLHGWCSQEKALALFDLALDVQPEVYVEIGVFGGASLFPAALACKLLEHGMVIGIDPWDRDEAVLYFDPVKDKEHLDWWRKLNLDYIYSSYLHCVKSWNLDGYVTTLRKTSAQAIDDIPPIDILHIDGNFGGDMPLCDVKLYLPKVRSGGYIWLNDALNKNRAAAIEYLLDSCYIVKAVNHETCILFRKK